jgi:hypothetical protein
MPREEVASTCLHLNLEFSIINYHEHNGTANVARIGKFATKNGFGSVEKRRRKEPSR